MNWFDRFTFVIRSSVTTIRERIEDPPRMIAQLICDMEEEHGRVRRSVAEAIADEIQLKAKVEKARSDSQEWMNRAKQALSRGDEASAKSALEQKSLAEQRADGLAAEHAQQKAQTEKLQRAVRDLESKIRQARQKKTLLLARLARADSEQRIQSALSKAEGCSSFAAFNRLEERVDRAEALCQANDILEDRDPNAEELRRSFEESEMKEKIEKELDELKRQVGIDAPG